MSLLLGGCLVLGVGVAMLLAADLGSDGYSTMVNGIALATDTAFWVVNLVVGVVFVAMAALRHDAPGRARSCRSSWSAWWSRSRST